LPANADFGAWILEPEGIAADSDLAAMLRAAIGQSTVAIVICDAAFRVRLANASGQALFGCGDGRSHGGRHPGWLGDVAQIDMDAALEAVVRHGFWRGSRVIASASGAGAPAQVEIEISRFRSNNGPGFTVTAREITPGDKLSRRSADGNAILQSPHLTQREKEVMLSLLEGSSNKATALKLAISPRTVEFHRKRLMQRFGAGSLVELIQNVVDGNRAILAN
jgi:DNA-binding CsgD family transcriptional regulator